MNTDLPKIEYKTCDHEAAFRDTPEHIDFHIKNGDYLNFLATALGFLQEALETSAAMEREHALAQELRQDLHYVNTVYVLTPRPEDISTGLN